ncbi:peptidase U32 [Desulfotomaculum nigrificans CO-1-SRB]|uniref:Peptidase U32 n=1 Tax=Desulfotomaculum nigrificans (strain DSM 14880 / VKM B-2319 / CO-1-SRB) TaxID=868595 RepID=F6B2U6_DESCC|nr:U32 family peptidase [Desulfotomaculum nigrificans]AEF95054.1 peptidase U32 [Desulfotomaculum nigrificans CO-1-SRB]
MKKLELLAPAGDLEKLKIAVLYGADAVYLGGRQFSLRAGAGNFDDNEMLEGIKFAHSRNVKVYVAINIYAHNPDLEKLPSYLEFLARAGVDAVIASDPGVIDMTLRLQPGLPIHLSTQANTTNWASAAFWQRLGLQRVVLARELSLAEIKEIGARVDVELEAFVHGAMCMSYSGRCLLSNFLTGRDANRGDCAQSCRWRYYLVEEKRPGQYFPVEEDSRGTYFMSSKDLCLLDYIPQLAAAGVTSFKIEGRMKSIHYLATVVKIYRQALDSYLKNPAAYTVKPEWMDEITKVSHREYTTGFLLGDQGRTATVEPGQSSYTRRASFVGLVLGQDEATGRLVVEQRNNFKVGEELEALTPTGDNRQVKVQAIFDGETGEPMDVAPHPQQILQLSVDHPLPPMAMLRRIQ